MQVIVNYAKEIPDKNGFPIDGAKYLPSLEYFMKSQGHEGLSTNKVYDAQSLIALATKMGVNAILCANVDTLAKLVNDKKPSLSNWRGSRIQLTDTIAVIVIAQLDQIYTVPEGTFLLKKDMAKLNYLHIKPKAFAYTLINSIEKMHKWLEMAQSDCWLMAVDIETDQHGVKKNEKSSSRVPAFNRETLDIAGLGETWITCCAFTLVSHTGEYRTAVLPLVNANAVDFWQNDNDYMHAISFLRAMLATEATKVFHNGLYDAYHLIRYQAWPNNWTLDTIGLSHSWYSELPKDLAFLASWTLYDAQYWKHLADATHKANDMPSYWLYNGKDSWVTARIAVHLLSHGEPHMFTNYKKKFQEVFPSLYGAFEGWKVNRAERDRLATEANARLIEIKRKLQVIADDPDFNPNSSKQKAELLYQTIGAIEPKRAKSKAKTDKKSRAFVAAQHPILTRIVELLNQYSIDSKAVSTYYSFLLWHDRLLFSLDPFGTETSRDASRASAAWVGTQIQNQPPYAKSMYCADEGFIGFEIDYSKSEAVCSAYLSECLPLIEALCFPELDKKGEKKDFYKHLGTLFFGMDYETVTKEFRNKVLKKINHGTNYMMQAETFIENLDDINVLYFAAKLLDIVLTPNPRRNTNEMTMKAFAGMLLESYHKPFKEVRIWWNKLKEEVSGTGRLVSPTGHVRIFFGDPKKDHGVWRSAVAHQPQNLSVELLNRGFCKAYKYAQQLGNDILRIKTQIHDSINGQVRIAHARTVIPHLAELVKARETIHGRNMVIDVDVEVYHTNWKEKVSWKDFLETTLPMLERQNLLTSTIDG